MKPVARPEAPSWADDARASLPVLLSRAEATAFRRCSMVTLWRRIRLMEIETVKNGRRVLIPRESLIRYLGG